MYTYALVEVVVRMTRLAAVLAYLLAQASAGAITFAAAGLLTICEIDRALLFASLGADSHRALV